MYGKVTRYFHDRGFGFIRGEDGNSYFIHHSNLNGEYIDSGYFVSYKPFQNDRIESRGGKRKYGKTYKKHG